MEKINVVTSSQNKTKIIILLKHVPINSKKTMQISLKWF